jgi:hypothetical protein
MDRGDHLPNARTLLHVARELDVTVEDLLEGAEVKPPKRPAMA